MRPAGESVRVLLVDDQHLFRDGLRGMLEADGITVVGEARSTAEAARLARERAPDVIVLGLNPSGDSAGEAVGQILSARADLPLVIVASSAGASEVIDTLAAGASGYLLKGMPADVLTCAIRQAARGNSVLSAEAMRTVLAPIRSGLRSPRGAQDGAHLTPRELEVLRLLASGAENAMIGRELSISGHTVKHHVTRILEKLEVDNRVAAAVRAVRDGLI